MNDALSLRCNVCEGLIAAPADVRFAECPSCRARLAIVRGDKTICTVRAADEEVAAVRHEVQELAGRVERLQLDLEWAEEKAQLGDAPTADNAPALGCFTIGLGCVVSAGFGVYMIADNPGHLLNWVLGLIVFFCVPVVAINYSRNRLAYDRAYANYCDKRDRLNWLDPANRPAPPPTTTSPSDDAIRASPP